MSLNISIFKILHCLKLCPIFVGSVHNFGRSNRSVFRTCELRVLTVIDCPNFAGAKGQ